MQTSIDHQGLPPDFERVVLPHLDAAYNLARWIVGDPAAAESVAQGAVLQAWKLRRSFRSGSRRAWLLQLVRSAAHACLEARRRANETPPCNAIGAVGHGGSHPQSAGPRPDAPALRPQHVAALDAALEALAVEQRECIILHEVERLSCQQIAQVTGDAVATVVSRLEDARQALRNNPRLLRPASDRHDVGQRDASRS
jgi:RNA polymerase sigma-70 factor (ECF subfamily)